MYPAHIIEKILKKAKSLIKKTIIAPNPIEIIVVTKYKNSTTPADCVMLFKSFI